MDVLDVARSCLHRWYVFVPLLLATAALTFLQVRNAVPQYSAQASYLVFEQPFKPNPNQPINPLESSENALQALVARLNSPDIVDRLTAGHKDRVITAAPAADGTIIDLSVDSPTAMSSSSGLDQLGKLALEALTTLQQRINAPAGNYFQLAPVSDKQMKVTYPSRSRNVAFTFLAGLTISALVTHLLNVTLTRRHRHRDAGSHRTEDGPTGKADIPEPAAARESLSWEKAPPDAGNRSPAELTPVKYGRAAS